MKFHDEVHDDDDDNDDDGNDILDQKYSFYKKLVSITIIKVKSFCFLFWNS